LSLVRLLEDLRCILRLSKSPIGILYGLFPRLNFFGCLAIAACLTPTDPIICAAIVGKMSHYPLHCIHLFIQCHFIGGKYAKKHVPLELRQILSAESAANDGLAFPFLTISLYLLTEPSRREVITLWVLVGWLCTGYFLIFFVYAHHVYRPSNNGNYYWSCYGYVLVSSYPRALIVVSFKALHSLIL
jgi:hypothetical protein